MSCDDGKFTLLGSDIRNTLARKLISVADRLRDLQTRFGLRPYIVRIIRTKWTGGIRGVGEEIITHQRDILPTPKVSDMASLAQIVQPIGLDEVGSLQLAEISGRYTEDELRGLDHEGVGPEPDEQVFYEIEYPNQNGGPSERRRFFARSAPMYNAGRVEWVVTLERAHEGRDRTGDLR